MEKVNFGVTKRGEEASLYVLENKNNIQNKILNIQNNQILFENE